MISEEELEQMNNSYPMPQVQKLIKEVRRLYDAIQTTKENLLVEVNILTERLNE